MTRVSVGAGVLLATIALVPVPAPGAITAEAVVSAAPSAGPPLQVPTDELDAALDCPAEFTGGAREPVLLVHGTYASPEENWGWNYAAALPTRGYDVCTLRLPRRSTGDIQVSSEYVVHAIRTIASRTGSKVDVMGHSQGGLQPRWALKWWPDVRELVDDLVMLATPNHGTAAATPTGATGCHASCLQMRPDSAFLTALNSDDETPGTVSYTSVYSATDELVQPAFPEATAALDGAVNVLLQDLCPGRPVTHVSIAGDAVAHAVVMDALDHPGPFDVGRFDPATCARTWFDGVDPSIFPDLLFENALTERFGDPDWVAEEPPLQPYAQGTSGQGDGGAGGSPDAGGDTEDPGGDTADSSGDTGGDARETGGAHAAGSRSESSVTSRSGAGAAIRQLSDRGPLPVTGARALGIAGFLLMLPVTLRVALPAVGARPRLRKRRAGS